MLSLTANCQISTVLIRLIEATRIGFTFFINISGFKENILMDFYHATAIQKVLIEIKYF